MWEGNSSPNFFKIKIKNMSYSFFLFAKLHDVVLGVSDEPYDNQYDDLVVMYDMFMSSEYDVDTKAEYECMVEFFQSLKAEMRRAKFQNLMKKNKQ